MEKSSILMFPWLAHGHIFPFLELAKNLSNNNFHVYFCSTPINLTSINQEVQDNVSIQLVELHLPVSPDLPPQLHTTKNVPPDLPPQLHTTKNVPPDLMPKLLQALGNSTSTFSTIITSLKPDLLIYDVFQPWAATIASSLGIPAVHFATSGAAQYSFFYHGFTLGKSGLAFPYEAIYQREYERKALQAVRVKLEDTMDLNSPWQHFKLSQEIILIKTCRALEGKYIDYLSDLCSKKVVPVGALVTQDNTEEDHLEIIKWLDEKPPFSTVFISFGSENYIPRDQMQEIAKGLESCQINFIWVVRFPLGKKESLDEALPNGFLDGVKERGRIVQGWAPQAKILAHPSTGGFISHCGFSSTIESIYFGLPVIGIPLKLDQPYNARLVVEAGVGVEVERDEDGHFTGDDVANAVNKVIVEKAGEGMRVRAAELGKKIKNEEQNAINEVVEELRRICMKYKQLKQ